MSAGELGLATLLSLPGTCQAASILPSNGAYLAGQSRRLSKASALHIILVHRPSSAASDHGSPPARPDAPPEVPRLQVRVVRIFNTYGPRMALDDGRVVSNFLSQALTGQPMTVYGDGSQSRSFQYVSDLIQGELALTFAYHDCRQQSLCSVPTFGLQPRSRCLPL